MLDRSVVNGQATEYLPPSVFCSPELPDLHKWYRLLQAQYSCQTSPIPHLLVFGRGKSVPRLRFDICSSRRMYRGKRFVIFPASIVTFSDKIFEVFADENTCNSQVDPPILTLVNATRLICHAAKSSRTKKKSVHARNCQPLDWTAKEY